MTVALKIDVATLVGAQLGVPPLLELLKKYDAGATFFFNLGHDETRSVVRSIFHGGLRKKIKQLTGKSDFSFTLLSPGCWLPAANISTSCSKILHQVKNAGFDLGIHSYDPVSWHHVSLGSDKGARSAIEQCHRRFQEITGEAPRSHSSGGWRISHHALRATQQLGLKFSSDSRGISPYIPLINAEIVACPQVPTTLPTLDEVIREGASTIDDAVNQAASNGGNCRIYTARAELEGITLLPAFEKLLATWHKSGFKIITLGKYLEEFYSSHMPRHSVALKRIAGTEMTVQGKDFLADPGVKGDIYPICKN